MALRSELLSVELPDASGKTVPYYTYDGYLEENDRHRIRAESRNLEQLKVTGGAVIGLIAFVVCKTSIRPPGDYLSPSSPSEESASPPLDSSLEFLEGSLDMTCSRCTAAAD
jgi:hypothetical protein